jgi:polar amino acid transport system substrate-binding protein
VRKLLVAVCGLALVAAFAVPAGAQGSKGPLVLGTNLPAPGFFDGGDTPDAINGGYEYDMAKAIADKLGYDGVKVVSVSFDALQAGKAKGFDIALSQVTITKARAKVVKFTVPYFSSDQGILVKKGTKVDASNIKSIQWGVQTTTTAQTFLKDKVKTDKPPRSYQETTQAFAALQAGQVDAVLLDTSIVLGQANASNGVFEVVGQFKTGETYGGIVPNNALRKKINATIKALKADGTLAALSAKDLTPQFGKDPASVPYLKP